MVYNPQPPPSYENLINELLAIYADATQDIRKIINRLNFDTITPAQQREFEKKVEAILKRTDERVGNWIDGAIERGYHDGIILAILEIGDAVTRNDAEKLAKMNSKLHKFSLQEHKKITYSDLLIMTNNTRQRVKDIISRVVSEVMKDREIGIHSRQFRKEIIRQLKDEALKEADFAIIDRAGKRWTTESYARMIARTKITQAQLAAKENEALQREAYYGVVSSHGTRCKICMPWEGRIVKLADEAPGNFPILSELKSRPGKTSVFHPTCKHTIHVVRTLEILPPQIKEKNNLT